MQIFKILVVFFLAGTPAFARDVAGWAYVRDGDTIVVSGTPVRLNGIDAPEASNRYGRQAKTFMERLLKGRVVSCELNGERSYDRWIGVCYIDHDVGVLDIGMLLIANGHALDCARYSGGRYRVFEPAGTRSRLKQASYCR
jgi:endonuclease YncB( thermonuclease family)